MLPRSIVAVWIFAWLSMVNGDCPTGCICANTVVLCSCSGENQFDVLTPIRGIEYIGKIFVHSCPRLTIPADAFAGLAVGQEISIMSIQNLTVDSFAFRDMLKYPDQFTIRDSHIHLLAGDAFAGFQQAKHMWFRNVTVATVQRNAFRHVSNVEYLYFREANFETVQSGAFANVRFVGNIFIRSKVTIQRMGAALFRHSKFDKLVIEDANISSMSAYALTGAARFGAVQLFNLRILSTSFKAPSDDDAAPLDEAPKRGKVEFYNAVADRLHLGAFADVDEVRLEHCQIDRLVSGPLTLRRVGVVSFVDCTVGLISFGAFANANQASTVKFENSNVQRIESGAFRHIFAVDYVMLLSSTVGTVEARAFENCTVNNLIVDGCTLRRTSVGSFMNVRAGQCRIVDNVVGKLAAQLFQDSAFALFSFERNNVSAEGASRWLSRMHGQQVNISGNWFAQMGNHLLSEVSFRSMEFSANRFQCDCDRGNAWLSDMVTLRRLVSESREPIVVINEDNVCWEPQKKRHLPIEVYRRTVCAETETPLKGRSFVQGLSCTVTSLWTECHCERSAKVVLDFTGASLALHTSVLRIANCSEVLLNWSLVGQIQTVIFSSVKLLLLAAQVFAKVGALRSIWIEDSSVRLEGRHVLTTISPVAQIVLKNVDIQRVPVHALSQSNAAEVLVKNSKLGRLEASMAEGSTIENLVILDCQIGQMSWSAFQGIRGANLRLIRNSIGNMDGLSFLSAVAADKTLCFEGNRIECNSTQTMRATLSEYNSCDNESNKCYAKGVTEGTMINLVNGNDGKENGCSLRKGTYFHLISGIAFAFHFAWKTF